MGAFIVSYEIAKRVREILILSLHMLMLFLHWLRTSNNLTSPFYCFCGIKLSFCWFILHCASIFYWLDQIFGIVIAKIWKRDHLNLSKIESGIQIPTVVRISDPLCILVFNSEFLGIKMISMVSFQMSFSTTVRPFVGYLNQRFLGASDSHRNFFRRSV